MITIMNKAKQPLSLNLAGGGSKILLPRDQASLSTDEFKSPEVQAGVKSGDLFVISMDDTVASSTASTTQQA